MDSSLTLFHGWDPTGVSSNLGMVPYLTLCLESCDIYCSSNMLISYTFVNELYFNSLYNYVQYFYFRMPAINADNVTQPVKLCIDLCFSHDQLTR